MSERRPPEPEPIPTEYVKVQMWDWAKGNKDTILETTGLGPCTGVAIYDPISRTGHLGHFVMPHEEKSEIEEFLNSAVSSSDTSIPTEWNVWVRGSSHDGDDDEVPIEYFRESRDYLITMLSSIGVVDPDVRWSKPNGTVDMRLDCSDGTCEIEVSDSLSITEQLGFLAMDND